MGRMLSFGSGSVVFFVVIFDAGRPGALTGHYVVCKAGGCLKKNLKKQGWSRFRQRRRGWLPQGSRDVPTYSKPLLPFDDESESILFSPSQPRKSDERAFFFFLLFSPVPNPSGPLEQVSGPADRSGRWQATGDGFCQAERAIWYFSNRNVSIEVGC